MQTLNLIGEFPVHALDEHLQGVIRQIHMQTQAPVGLIASSVLGAMGLACQDLVDVSPKAGLIHPVSLFFITKADSGERKTAVDELVMKPFRTREQLAEQHYRDELEKHTINLSVWQTEQKAHKAALNKAILEQGDTSTLKQALRDVEAAKPSLPLNQKWLLNDVTSAAIKHAIDAYGRSIGVFSDEAAHLFSSDFMRETSVLNSLWGAKPISAMRVSTQGATTIGDYRFSLSLMVQGQLFERFLDRQGEQARESGFFARCLLCEPSSTQGSRFMIAELPTNDVGAQYHALYLSNFHLKVEKLLDCARSRREAGKPRVCLTLSPEARAKWFEMANLIEGKIGVMGVWREFRDFASKFMEHVSRIAAVLHTFTASGQVISDVTMHAAILIVEWYFQHFIQQFKARSVPDDIHQVNELDRWLGENLHRSVNGVFQKNDVRQQCPNCIRNTAKLDRALNTLVLRGAVEIFSEKGKGKNKHYITYIQPYQRRLVI
ncbi:YfjI family protein [Aeromonas sp. 102P]|uniref:YfjI family protein n=1 Tax=Aeromonas sp. 102P TaxID=3452711 RepID=UPI003F796048